MRDSLRVVESWREQIMKSGGEDLPQTVRKTFIPESVDIPGGDVRKAAFVVSTGDEDRDGDTVNPDGWSLDDYRKNPVVLWAHDTKSPAIAKSLDIGVKGGKLRAVTEFPEKGIYPFADTVFGLVKGGFIRGTSVGFHPIEAEPRRGREKGIDFKRQALYEFSILPIPSNRNALVEAKSAGYEMDEVVKWAEAFLEKAEDSGLWIPKFAIQKALRLILPLQVSVPAVPLEEAKAAPEGHATAGADPDGVTKGDVPGHEFHGNQHTGGQGGSGESPEARIAAGRAEPGDVRQAGQREAATVGHANYLHNKLSMGESRDSLMGTLGISSSELDRRLSMATPGHAAAHGEPRPKGKVEVGGHIPDRVPQPGQMMRLAAASNGKPYFGRVTSEKVSNDPPTYRHRMTIMDKADKEGQGIDSVYVTNEGHLPPASLYRYSTHAPAPKKEGEAEVEKDALDDIAALVTKEGEPDVVKYIREENGKWCVYSEEGKKLGEHDNRADAVNQLQAIEANKHKKEATMELITKIADDLFSDQEKGTPPWLKQGEADKPAATDAPPSDAEPDPNDPNEPAEQAAGEAPEGKGTAPDGQNAQAGPDPMTAGLLSEIEPLKQGGDPTQIATALKAALEKFAAAFMAQYANPAAGQATAGQPGAAPPPPPAPAAKPTSAPPKAAAPPPPPQRKGFDLGGEFISEDDIRETIQKAVARNVAEATMHLTGKLPG